MENKIEGIKRDLLNAPQHIFGNHAGCKPYYCHRTSEDVNHAAYLTTSRIMMRIEEIIARLVHHVEDLLEHLTNNEAEQFMSLICKMLGGKRVNYCLGKYI